MPDCWSLYQGIILFLNPPYPLLCVDRPGKKDLESPCSSKCLFSLTSFLHTFLRQGTAWWLESVYVLTLEFLLCCVFKGEQIAIAQNPLQWEWGNFPFVNWNGICWGLLLQLVQWIKIHFMPQLESYMWELKFEKNCFKKSPI